MVNKELLYDWHGLNGTIFRHVNAIQGDVYDSAMVFLSRSGDHHNFPYYWGTLAVWALVGFLVRKLSRKGGAPHYLTAWVGVLAVLAAGYAADGLAVRYLKNEFAYPRPYIVYNTSSVRVLDGKETNDDQHSFPSGHASFATTMVTGMWPVLSPGTALIGILWVAGVCWSRMAVGMHFPADVLAGVLMSFVIVMLVRLVIYRILRAFGVRC